MNRTVILVIFASLACALTAADFEVDAYVDHNHIGLNDALQLTVEVIGDDAGKPELPAIDGFRVAGTSTGSSTSVTIVNGRMEQEVRRTYTYRLLPQRKGVLMIPPITVKAGKEIRATKAIEVTVVEGSTQRAPVPQRNNQQNQQTSDMVQDNLFIRAELSKSKPYLGEPITVIYTLYNRYDIADMQFGEEPSFTGFWKEDLYTAQQRNFKTVNLEGQRFNAMKLRTVELIPTQSGRQTIPPLTMQVDILTQARSFFDFGNTRRVSVKSDPLIVDVQPLPDTGKPADFSGAIGRFTIDSAVSESTLRAGEPFTYSITIAGTGNFDNFTLPTAPQANHIHFMEPEVERSGSGSSGSVTMRFPAYIEEEGSFRIPATPFTFFDTRSKEYKIVHAPARKIEAKAADPALTRDNPYIFDANVSGARRLSHDIDHIVYDAALNDAPPAIVADPREEGKRPLAANPMLWMLWALMTTTLAGSSWLARHNRKMAGDAAYTRQRQADRILRKYLKEAEAQTDNVSFYAAAQAGLGNYLADKLRQPRGATLDSLLSTLRGHGAPTDLIARLNSFLRRCSEARFMPGGFSPERIGDDNEELKAIVSELSRWKEGK